MHKMLIAFQVFFFRSIFSFGRLQKGKRRFYLLSSPPPPP